MQHQEIAYNDQLDYTEQVDTEEEIATMIWQRQGKIASTIGDLTNFEGFSPDDCNDLGRDILYRVLRRFRPDLFADHDHG